MKNESFNDWTLERFMLGELPRRETDRIRRRLLSDPALRNRISLLRRSDSEILLSFPKAKMVAQIEDKLGRKKAASGEKIYPHQRRFIRLAWMPAALGLVVGVYLVTSRRSDHSTSYPQENLAASAERLKGTTDIPVATAGLHIYRQVNGGIEELGNESAVLAHDLIQLAYTAGSFKYGMIFSLDGRGTVTLHFPDDPSRPPLLQRGQLVLLQKAYELDDAPAFERFFFVVSESKINPSDILDQARQWALHPRQAEAGGFVAPPLEQISILLRKKEHRYK